MLKTHNKSETLHIRIEPDIKKKADNTLSHLGLSTAEAVNIFLHQVVICNGIPFAVRMPSPNAETKAAMQEARDMMSGKIKAKKYDTADELMEDLLNDAEN